MRTAEKEREHRGFEADADYAIPHQEPLRARVLLVDRHRLCTFRDVGCRRRGR